MIRNTQIALAIATALGAGTTFAQAVNPPTLAQALAGVPFYIAGSSAAKNAVLAAIQGNLCGNTATVSNALVISSSPNTNFFAISCAPASGVAGADGNTFYTIYYRAEGGSVAGMLPIVNNVSVNQLDLTNTALISCATTTACTATVNGTSTANGADDSFTGDIARQPVFYGIADVEPAALTGNNYPSAYLTSVWGPNNQAGLQNLTSTQLFDEVYDVYVNENSSVFTENPLNLSMQTVQGILTHKIKNWSLVTDTAGNLVTNGSLAITVVNREAGSGSRAATDLLLAGDQCQTEGGQIYNGPAATPFTDYFSAGDVLTAAAAIPGSITYATIDASKTNMVKVNLNGVVPSNLAAATGQWPFWVEAVGATNANVTLNANQTAFQTFFQSTLLTEATAPHVVDILAFPGSTNTPHANVLSTASVGSGTVGTATIYTNPFTRSKVTCNLPAPQSGLVQ